MDELLYMLDSTRGGGAGGTLGEYQATPCARVITTTLTRHAEVHARDMAAARAGTRSRTDRKLLTTHLYEIHVWCMRMVVVGHGVVHDVVPKGLCDVECSTILRTCSIISHCAPLPTTPDEGGGAWALVVYGERLSKWTAHQVG